MTSRTSSTLVRRRYRSSRRAVVSAPSKRRGVLQRASSLPSKGAPLSHMRQKRDLKGPFVASPGKEEGTNEQPSALAHSHMHGEERRRRRHLLLLPLGTSPLPALFFSCSRLSDVRLFGRRPPPPAAIGRCSRRRHSVRRGAWRRKHPQQERRLIDPPLLTRLSVSGGAAVG